MWHCHSVQGARARSRQHVTLVPPLVESTAAQVVGDDDVSDGVEDELNVVSVGGARLVTVDLFVGRLVLGLELGLYVGGCLVVHLLACTGNNTRQS